MSNLKDEVLRLFREDEGFRMEVLRMLGIMDVNVALSQLTDSVNKVTKSIEDLREEIRKPWEENHRIWEEVQKREKTFVNYGKKIRRCGRIYRRYGGDT